MRERDGFLLGYPNEKIQLFDGRRNARIPVISALGVPMMARKEKGIWETLIRIIYIGVGIGALAISAWFLFAVSPFNPYGFGIFLVVGIILLVTGIWGSRKDVFTTFFGAGV